MSDNRKTDLFMALPELMALPALVGLVVILAIILSQT